MDDGPEIFAGGYGGLGISLKTTLSAIINFNTLTMLLAKGNPCEVKYNEYQLISKR